MIAVVGHLVDARVGDERLIIELRQRVEQRHW